MCIRDRLHAVSNYDGPPGGKGLVEAVAEHFSENYGWDISAENVALTNGSQSSFFYLFNALAGEQTGVGHKKVLFPLCPEYLGYAEVGLSDGMFTSVRPSIDIDEERNLYKYSIDFERLEAEVDWSEIGVVCVSRPTNPTGNVLTDDEVERLDVLAKKHGVPLIIDNAYGTPFPSIIHVPATPVWNDNIILCLSMSKLGLPGEIHAPEPHHTQQATRRMCSPFIPITDRARTLRAVVNRGTYWDLHRAPWGDQGNCQL